MDKPQLDQEIFDLYDHYAHNRIDRRNFMEQLSVYAVGGLTVNALMEYLMPKYFSTLQVQPQDPRLKSEYIEYASPKGGGTIKKLLSRP
ncbi:MAG TPA: dienelactone hydrolase family protein, partial [Saprospiraceae bacterium]|nr:dienelactone hydrolase family protein [Saprospiraceae bacterium]